MVIATDRPELVFASGKWDDARIYATHAAVRHVEVQITYRFVSPNVPDWTNPTILLVPYDAGSASLDKVYGYTLYAARVRVVDVFGQKSAWSAIAYHKTVRDYLAPKEVEGLQLIAANTVFIASWEPNTEADLSHYELRYAADDGSGLRPVVPWIIVKTAVTKTIVQAAPGVKYWAQVRAVDLSGNASDWS